MNSARRIVFVDPDDPRAPFWWPAMVVPQNEHEAFRRSVGSFVPAPLAGQLLVCYFEDGSFSIVAESDTRPFAPAQPPYTNYAAGAAAAVFRRDKAVQLATNCAERGDIPPHFSWLSARPPHKQSHKQRQPPSAKRTKTERQQPSPEASPPPVASASSNASGTSTKRMRSTSRASLPSPDRSAIDSESESPAQESAVPQLLAHPHPLQKQTSSLSSLSSAALSAISTARTNTSTNTQPPQSISRGPHISLAAIAAIAEPAALAACKKRRWISRYNQLNS